MLEGLVVFVLDPVSSEDLMKKLMLLAGAALVLGACAESPTAPAATRTPGNRLNDALVCRSGYLVAYDENGNPYCAPASDAPQATAKQAPKG